MSRDLVLGTAGHIDHGKSSLVYALTGTDPDRLSEEKRRGITIELGFARLDLPGDVSLGIVDVPGHERFVRQMIAGSSGIDFALLCIAADDGIMPQTLEHLAVLELLGVPRLVVALTKIDLVDDEWTSFMADEIEARLEQTPYAHAPVVSVSSKTGQGLDDLKGALAEMARATERIQTGSIPRLPVDRVFSVKGAGTVITGTLWSGKIALDDEIEVLPSGLRARVRGIQIHGTASKTALAGHRVALNLNALSTSEIRPGSLIAAPGAIIPTDRFDAELAFLGVPGKTRPLESGTRVRVAHGTRETFGRVLLIGQRESLACGERAFAQIRLEEPLPVSWRDRFVVRSYSPVHVIGGGTVLRAHPRRTTNVPPEDIKLLEALCTQNESAVAKASFATQSLPVTASALAAASGLSVPAAQRELDALVAVGAAVRLEGAPRGSFYMAKSNLQRLRSAIENALLKFHAENPTAPGIAKDILRQRAVPAADAESFDALLADAVSAGAAIASNGEVAHPKAGAAARKAVELATETLAATLAAAGGTPPTVSDLIAASGVEPALAHRALNILEKEGAVRRVSQEFFFDAAAFESLAGSARARLEQGPATAAELKEAMNTSRKYAIPLLEHFDSQGMTRRDGDLRYLR